MTGPDGRSFAPDDAWRHADDGFDRARAPVRVRLLPHRRAPPRSRCPAGRYDDRGDARARPSGSSGGRSRSAPGRHLGARASRSDRSSDLAARGWRSADLHVHMNYGGAYRATPRRLAFQARAEDLALVENLIVNKEGRIPDVAYPWDAIPVSTATHRDHARPGVSHQRLGPHRTAGPAGSPAAAGLRGLSGDAGGESGADQRRRGRPGAGAGRGHRLRPPVRQRSRPGGHHAPAHAPSSRWIWRSARSTTTRRSASWTTRWPRRTSGIARSTADSGFPPARAPTR